MSAPVTGVGGWVRVCCPVWGRGWVRGAALCSQTAKWPHAMPKGLLRELQNKCKAIEVWGFSLEQDVLRQ